MIADVVRAIGRQHVTVTCLMGPGIDPHVYRACEGDVHRLANADIIFYNGLHLEGKMAQLLNNMKSMQSVYAVTDGLPRHQLQAPPDFPDAYDPHVWLDVRLWRYTIPVICDALCDHDPTHTEHYKINAQAYAAQLDELDQYVVEKAQTLPAHKRILVTAHDAFGYFGTAYGFEVVGLQGISTEAEAGTRDITNLVDFLISHEIPAIFVESSIPQRAIEAVQCATQARGYRVTVGPELFSDALGNPGTPEATYLGMVKHNIDAIVTTLDR